MLIIALLSVVISLFVELGYTETESLNAFHLAGNPDFLPTLGGYIAALSIGLIFGTLMSFKDRKKQMILANLAMILTWIFVAFEIYIINSFGLQFSLWLILPFEAGFLCFMAKKLIKKDDDLIKSVDRIR